MILKGRIIAKTPHRIFEIYAIRDEAIQALTPKNPVLFDYKPLASATFKQLSITVSDCILHVQFVGSPNYDVNTLDELRSDLQILSQDMSMNGKVLIDFQDVETFCSDSINLIVEFNKRMRNQGSRVVLCCISSNVLELFFPARKKTG